MLYSHKWVCSAREWSLMKNRPKKFVDLEKLYNFVAHNFFLLEIILMLKYLTHKIL